MFLVRGSPLNCRTLLVVLCCSSSKVLDFRYVERITSETFNLMIPNSFTTVGVKENLQFEDSKVLYYSGR